MQTPTFTVIVPTRQRPQKLARCLKTLADQEFSKSDYEVVVVSDGSAGEYIERIACDTATIACRLLTQSHLGAAAARNLGASAAKGRLLAFTDDDCRPAPDWLTNLERQFNMHRGSVLVGGRVVNELTDDIFASTAQALTEFLYQHFNHDPQRARMLASNNFCVPADAFRQIGGFDQAFTGAGGEDREFCLRWAYAGHGLVYAPAATVYHAHDMTLSKFIRQHFAYGRGAAILRRRALERGYGPIALEPVSFYWDLLRYPQQAPGIGRRWPCAALFAVSQLANTLGYLHVRIGEHTG